MKHKDPSNKPSNSGPQFISIDDYRDWQGTQIAQFLKEYPNKVILINTPPGVGKTEELAKQLKDSSFSVLWAAPNHLQAEQVVQIWEDEAVHLKSRQWMLDNNELECPSNVEVADATTKQLPAVLYCNEDCPEYPCKYLGLRKSAVKSRLVIAMHQHHLVNVPRALDKDIIVFDENPASNFRCVKEIHDTDLIASIRLARFIKNNRVRNNIIKVMNSLKDKGAIPQEAHNTIPKLALSKINQDIANRNIGQVRGKWVLPDIIHIIKNEVPIYKSGNTIRYVKESWIPDDRPVFILDSTHTLNSLKLLLPEREIVEIGEPDGILEQHVEVIHVYGASYKSSTLVAGDKPTRSGTRLMNGIKERFGDECSIIATKKYEERAELANYFRQVDHFGNIRGRNDFQDADDLIVIGFWLKPIKVMIKDAMNEHGNIDYSMDDLYQVTLKDLRKREQSIFVAEDGIEYPVVRYKFSNQFVDNYFKYSIESELSQAVGRARIHEPSERRRRLWIVTDVLPKFIRVDRSMHYNEFLGSKKDQTRKLIKQGIELAEDPNSAKDVHKTILNLGYNISLSTVQHYRYAVYKEVMSEK